VRLRMVKTHPRGNRGHGRTSGRSGRPDGNFFRKTSVMTTLLCKEGTVANVEDVVLPPLSPGQPILPPSRLGSPAMHLHMHVHSSSGEDGMQGNDGDGGGMKTLRETTTLDEILDRRNTASTDLRHVSVQSPL
jgi:hypothetical protein